MKTKPVARRLRSFLRAESAVSTLEYAMMVGLMAIGVAAAAIAFSDDLQTAISGNIGGDVSAMRPTGVGPVQADTTAP